MCPAKPQFFLRGIPPLTWSPTGDRIAFVTFEGELGIADSDGRILGTYGVPKSGQIRSISWSEEGDLLALTLNTYSDGQDSYLVSIPEGKWKRIPLGEGDSIIEFWVTIH